jgi:hypothetical protein
LPLWNKIPVENFVSGVQKEELTDKLWNHFWTQQWWISEELCH